MSIKNWFSHLLGKDKSKTVKDASPDTGVIGTVVEVFNTQRVFGEAKRYFVTLLRVKLRGRRDDIVVPIAFTADSFIKHMKRGMRQDEDVERALKHLGGSDLKYVKNLEELDEII